MQLLSLAEKTRFALQKLKYAKVNRAFKMEHPQVLLPPEYFIYETYRLNYDQYYYDGKSSAEEIVILISKYYDLTNHKNKFLDWGCGPGRIVRHLPPLLPHSEIHGTDYNEKYINWCSNNLGGIKFSLNDIDPPLKYPSAFFDIVIGLSIFTHLSKEKHTDWINELHRIIKTGGMLLITTQGQAYHSRLTAVEKIVFDQGQLVTRKYLNEGNRLYSSFHSYTFIRGLISEKFEVAELIPGKMENEEPVQDSWVLRKI